MSPDKSDIEAHGLNASSCLHPTASFLHFLPPWPPTLLQSFPSCPEVIFVWILAELHCLMTAQSWDFMMQSMSKIGKEQKRSFSKCSRYRRGSYMWEICHHSRGLIMIPAHRERKRAPRYEGSNWAGSVSDSMKRGICLLWNPVGVCELHITHDLWLGRLFFFFLSTWKGSGACYERNWEKNINKAGETFTGLLNSGCRLVCADLNMTASPLFAVRIYSHFLPQEKCQFLHHTLLTTRRFLVIPVFVYHFFLQATGGNLKRYGSLLNTSPRYIILIYVGIS